MRSAIALALLACVTGLVSNSAEAQVTWNSVTLSWTAPGDDSLTGTATQYDLRYSTAAITSSNFASATRWTGTLTPIAPGARQTVTITGLSPNTTYYFALKTADEVPNWSGLSNVISRTTQAAPDTTRPGPVATLALTGTNETAASLRWNAVGDDSLTGTASTYDVRHSTSPITPANFAQASQASGEPAPASSGSQQSFMLNGLSRQTTYYVAMKVADEAGNWSALSNVISFTTPDMTPPAVVRDLSVGFLWFGWRAGVNAVADATTASAVRPRQSGGR